MVPFVTIRRVFALTCAAVILIARPVQAYDTIGNGFGSKWGASPAAGTGAVVTWGFMPDGTPLAENFVFGDAITGTSNITALRNSVDANYGVGAFDTAIQNAFNTWSAVANVRFVGPVTDPGLPVAAPGATTPNIRIGAFQAVPDAAPPDDWFKYTSAIGIGPPGPFFEDPFSGDVIFNVAGIGTVRPYQIAPGDEDIDPVDVFQYGDDVEGLFVHELGHAAIGLDHPRWAGENPDQRMMYVGDFTRNDDPFCCQSINRQLHVDDIAAAQYVYGIRGDYNRDGQVSAADYSAWRKFDGQNVTAGTGRRQCRRRRQPARLRRLALQLRQCRPRRLRRTTLIFRCRRAGTQRAGHRPRLHITCEGHASPPLAVVVRGSPAQHFPRP
jgi:hypothetical protein